MKKNKSVLIMAGGTGGHIFPGLAVARLLEKEGWRVCWLGTSKRMEARLVPSHGYPIRFIDVVGVRGKGLVQLLKTPFMVVRAVSQAIEVIRVEKPAIVLGFGGFASGPGGVAAWLLRKHLVLHEQNAVAGVTNRILAYFSDRVLMAFPDTFRPRHHALFVGNPVREEISQLAEPDEYQLFSQDKKLKVLILGGSLGAEAINFHVPKMLAQTECCDEISIWHQVGKGNKNRITKHYQTALASNHDVRIDEFIDDMAQAYQWADIAICRAGALTVSEIAVVGIPAIFVPFPHAVDDHQTANARWLADHQAAIILPQELLESGKFGATLCPLLGDREKLAQMGRNAAALAITDAAEKVAAVCRSLIENDHPDGKSPQPKEEI